MDTGALSGVGGARAAPPGTAAPRPRPRARDDLGYYRQERGGKVVVFVRDPLRSYFVGLNELQAAMMQLLDGRRTDEEIAAALEEQFEVEVPIEKVAFFVGFLEQKLLLDVDWYEDVSPKARRAVSRLLRRRDLVWPAPSGGAPGPAPHPRFAAGLDELARGTPSIAARHFRAVLDDEPSNERARLIVATIHEAFFRAHRTESGHLTMVHLWNPDRFLGWLDRRVGRLVWGPWGAAFLVACALSTLPALVNLRPVDLSSITLVDLLLFRLVVVLPDYFAHEVLGHGFACKHYGGNVEDVGVMLFYGVLPGAYTDVTDVHMFARRGPRVMVYLAGMLAQFPLLCAWCHLYYLTTDDFVLHKPIYLWLLYSLYTYAKNLIPTIVGFDGYYALAHVLDRPALAEEAAADWRRRAREWYTGAPEGPAPPPARRRVDAAFGVASALMFVAFTAFVVFYVLAPIATEYLGGAGLLLALGYGYLTLGRRLFGPVRDALGFALRRPRALWRPRRLAGFAATLATLAAALAAPWPRLTDGEMVVQPAIKARVFVPDPKAVDRIVVREGSRVRAGDVVAWMRDDELEVESAEAEADVEVRRQRALALRRGARPEARDSLRAAAKLAGVAGELANVEAARGLRLGAQGLAAEAAADAARAAAASAGGEAVRGAWALREALAGERVEDLASAEAALAEALARKEKVDDRRRRLAVRSPVDGVIVTPHVEEQEHRRLEVGDWICDVYADERVFAEVHLDRGSWLRGVAPGQRVALQAAALRGPPVEARVERVRQRAEADGRLVLETSALDNPGWPALASGHARVYGEPRSIAYQLFVVPFAAALDLEAWKMFWG